MNIKYICLYVFLSRVSQFFNININYPNVNNNNVLLTMNNYNKQNHGNIDTYEHQMLYYNILDSYLACAIMYYNMLLLLSTCNLFPLFASSVLIIHKNSNLACEDCACPSTVELITQLPRIKSSGTNGD